MGEAGSFTFFGGYVAASSAKITGITAFSQKPCTSCSGEYESSAAPCCSASATARASEPGLWTVSASVNSSHLASLCATFAPADMALFLPVQFSGRGGAEITVAFSNDLAISAVRSVDASSTTITSKAIPVCDTRDSRHSERQASSFRAGTITDTTGVVSGVIDDQLQGR